MPSLLLLNGSPRGEHSNSMKMLTRLAQGWTSAGGGEIIVLHLAQKSDFKKAVALYTESDTVLLGMPLYADRLPGLVKEYFEELAISPGFLHTQHLPVTGFLVQSGFMEALHCRPLERYLQKLSGKISSGYAGTIVRGGGEALRSAPEESFHKLWKQLNALGAQLATQKRFQAETLHAVAGMERLSPVLAFALRLLFPFIKFYWNRDLKKNGVWAERYARPYEP